MSISIFHFSAPFVSRLLLPKLRISNSLPDLLLLPLR